MQPVMMKACSVLRSRALLQRRLISSSRILQSEKPFTYTNPSEIAHFNELAESWWDPHGSSRLLHLMNPLRHDFISSCFGQDGTQPMGLHYLDVGCGGGIFAESAARLSSTASVTAIDPSAAVIAVARQHALTDPDLQRNSRLRYLKSGIEELALPAHPEEGVDVLALWEVIEHVDRPADFLRACSRHVKPGGWLVLSTIARTWPSWIVTNLLAEDILRIVPRGTHDWTKYLQATELREFFANERDWGVSPAGLRVQGCVYLPGLGWKFVQGSEHWGNYFFGVQRHRAEK